MFCEARSSGILTTAERYFSEGASPADRTDSSFSRLAVKHQRIRPYWLSVMHRKDYTRSGDIEVAAAGRLELIKAADSIQAFLEEVVADINAQPCLEVTCGDETPIIIDKKSKDYDFGLRLELKNRELTVISESSYYSGPSSL